MRVLAAFLVAQAFVPGLAQNNQYPDHESCVSVDRLPEDFLAEYAFDVLDHDLMMQTMCVQWCNVQQVESGANWGTGLEVRRIALFGERCICLDNQADMACDHGTKASSTSARSVLRRDRDGFECDGTNNRYTSHPDRYASGLLSRARTFEGGLLDDAPSADLNEQEGHCDQKCPGESKEDGHTDFCGNRADGEVEIYTVPNDYSYPTKVTNNGAGENNLLVTHVCDFDGDTGANYNCKFIQTTATFEFGNPFERDDCCAP